MGPKSGRLNTSDLLYSLTVRFFIKKKTGWFLLDYQCDLATSLESPETVSKRRELANHNIVRCYSNELSGSA